MNERLLLEQAVVNEPYDRAPLKALIDWLYENAGMTFRGACRVALSLSRFERNARECAAASRLFFRRGAKRDKRTALIRAFTQLRSEQAFVLFIKPGSRPPRLIPQGRNTEPAYDYPRAVEVGARWVLWWDAIWFPPRPRRAYTLAVACYPDEI